MAADAVALAHQLLEAPFPEIVKSLGLAIAQAQYELDLVGLRLAQLMSGNDPSGEMAKDAKAQMGVEATEGTPSLKVKFGEDEYSLLELGFTPTFYQFVDTIIEVKMSISMRSETSYSQTTNSVNVAARGGFFGFFNSARLSVATVSASYASKYQYSAEGSSLMRTKLVPIPPPAVLEERIRALLQPPTT